MANNLNSKVWTLGSATLEIVTAQPLQIESITVTWSGASDGNVLLEEPTSSEGSSFATILSAKTIGFASATSEQTTLSQHFPFYGATFQGLTKTAMTGLDGEQGVQILVR